MLERPHTLKGRVARAARVALVVGLAIAVTGPYPRSVATEICEPGSTDPFCVDGSVALTPTWAASASALDIQFDNTSATEHGPEIASQKVWLDHGTLSFIGSDAPPPVVTPSEDLPDGLLIAGERPGDTSACTDSDAFVGCAAGHGTLVVRVTGSGFLDGFYPGTFGISSVVNVPDTAASPTLAHYRASMRLCVAWSFPTKCADGTGDINVLRSLDPTRFDLTMSLRQQVSISGATIDTSVSRSTVHLDGASSIANGLATDREYKIVKNASTCGSGTSELALASRDGRSVTVPGAFAVTDCDRLADVTLAKTDAPDPVVVRRTLVYTLTASNLGPAVATGVTIRDRLPTYVDPRELPNGCSPAEGGQVVVCDAGDLAVGASAAFRIPTDPLLIGERTNIAEVTSSSPDPDESNNGDSAATRVLDHSPVSTCVAPEDGLAAWFAGDGTTEDLAGDNDGGTLMNGVSFTDGTVGRAFELRPPVAHVSVPDGAALNITENLTLDSWVRLASVPAAGGDARTVIEKTTNEGAATYAFAIDPHDAEGDARLVFTAGLPGSAPVTSDVDGWEAERWYHVAAVRSGNNVTLYRDGLSVGSGALAGPAPATPGADVRIGVATDGTRALGGDADEVAIHSRALSADEIAEIHGTGAAGRCKTGRPTNVATPTLTGTPSPDEDLTCHPGSWEGDIERLSYVWDRAPRMTADADDPAWAAIDGANGPLYVVQDIDVGSRVRCREIVTTATGSVSAASNSLRADEGPPVSIQAPVVAGAPIVGKELTCDPGAWKNEPDLAYRWFVDGSEIDGVTASTFIVRLFDGDDGRDNLRPLACEVTGTNDVGTTTSERSLGVQPVRGVPKIPDACVFSPILCAGRVTRTETGTRPLDVTLACTPGRRRDTGLWRDDSGALFGGYEYEWLREGAPIAGATSQTYAPTSDDLGRHMACRTWALNPAGRSSPLGSRSLLLGLPAGASTGTIYKTGGDNEFDPVNLLAISDEYKSALDSIAARRFAEAMNAQTEACISDPPPGEQDPEHQEYGQWIGEVLSAAWTCDVLTAAVDEIVTTRWGAFWVKPGEHLECEPLPADEAAPSVPCPALDIPVAPVDPTNPNETLTAAEIDFLRPVTPQRILWDVNDDGRVDADCPGTAPVLRSLYRPGRWTIRAVVIGPSSDASGVYDSSRVVFAFPSFDEAPATPSPVRDGQPFSCRTSFEPPPKTAPDHPCVTDATIGRVRIQGNLCPVNIRAIDPKDLKLDDGTKALLRKIAENQSLDRSKQAASRAAKTHAAGAALDPADRYISSTGLNMSAALTGTGSYTYNSASNAILTKLDAIAGFNLAKADFALDQIYIANGPSKVNGVQVIPQAGTSSLLVPADAVEAMNTVKGMTLASANARTALAAKGSEVPLDSGGQLSKTFADAAGAANNVFSAPDLNALTASLKDKLNLGPFKLAGVATVTMKDDGTVTLTAKAILPGLGVSPGGEQASTSVTLEGDRNGNLVLRGAKLRVPNAYLFGTQLKDVELTYDSSDGLEAKGTVLLWPSGPGVAINQLKLGTDGSFNALDVDYLAPAGTGIPISGPFQVYLTKIGGGFSTNPDEFFGRTALSVGPSPGGGCPTVGVEAEFRIHTAPSPFWARATGEGQLACVPLANVTFEVRGDGYVSLDGRWNFDAGPIYLGANLGGRVRLPNWTVEASGEGGIRKVLSGRVEAVLSNIGLAACGKIVMPDPFADIAGGAAVRFTDGRPPLHFGELLANLKLFTGCDLSAWRSVQPQPAFAAANVRLANGVQAVGATLGEPLLIADGTPGIALSFEGAGDAPLIKLRRPDGTLLDLTDAHDGKQIINAYGVVLDEEDRTVVLISEPQAGQWTVEVAEGSEPIADIRTADVLPVPSVEGTVSGTGAKRKLSYDVESIPGQVVHFVEHADGASQTIATVEGGGSGEVKFTVTESESESSARSIVAEVIQDGLPRDNITVVEAFEAPNPAVGRPKDPTIKRQGTTALVKWGAAKLAGSYEVTMRSSDGTAELFTTSERKLVIPDVGRRQKLRVSIVAVSAAGRRGPPATVRLR